MPFKDLIKRKDKISPHDVETSSAAHTSPVPDITILRTDTNTQEVIQPPIFEGDEDPITSPPATPLKRTLSRFRKSSNASITSQSSDKGHAPSRQLSQRFRLSRASSTNSVHVPSDLPTIPDPYEENGDQQEKEAQWEERATRLAKESTAGNATVDDVLPLVGDMSQVSVNGAEDPVSGSSCRPRSISDAATDENIQEGIRLHEAGDLTKATEMFGRLAETGNVLSQVLYGLSLRHGWGCTPDPTKAFTYLRRAASNSAAIEAEALKAGQQKGGAAKGELVLAIFELANCFRYGWGVEVDKPAARQYYETAANLGDKDAMNEAAWCYLKPFGGKRDKFKAARLLQLAESAGSETVGNSWIRKEKYNPK